jgi:hypothetical protein
MGLESERILVVSPDWGNFWNLYCLEYAVQQRKLGHEIVLLDLSELNSVLTRKKFLKFWIKLTKRNRMDQIVRFETERFGIKLETRAPKKNKGNNSFNFDAEREKVFLRLIASKFSFVTGTRNTTPSDLSKKEIQFQRLFFLNTLEFVYEVVKKYRISKVVTVNGRYVVDGAVVQASRELGIELSLLESASPVTGKFFEYKSSPHDLEDLMKEQIRFWNEADDRKNLVAENGLQLKYQGKALSGFAWKDSEKQIPYFRASGILKLLAYFPSSDREFAAFPEFDRINSFGGNQETAFKILAKAARALGYSITIRVHPQNILSPIQSQKQFAKIDNTIWEKLATEFGCEIISSESQISSQSLMAAADLNVTYASSIVVESILLNKPTLILGNAEQSFYLEECCAFDEELLIEKLRNPIQIVDSTKLYPWSYWMMNAGNTFELFDVVEGQYIYHGGSIVNSDNILGLLTNKLKSFLGLIS